MEAEKIETILSFMILMFEILHFIQIKCGESYNTNLRYIYQYFVKTARNSYANLCPLNPARSFVNHLVTFFSFFFV